MLDTISTNVRSAMRSLGRLERVLSENGGLSMLVGYLVQAQENKADVTSMLPEEKITRLLESLHHRLNTVSGKPEERGSICITCLANSKPEEFQKFFPSMPDHKTPVCGDGHEAEGFFQFVFDYVGSTGVALWEIMFISRRTIEWAEIDTAESKGVKYIRIHEMRFSCIEDWLNELVRLRKLANLLKEITKET